MVFTLVVSRHLQSEFGMNAPPKFQNYRDLHANWYSIIIQS